jgi:hypothetical protein
MAEPTHMDLLRYAMDRDTRIAKDNPLTKEMMNDMLQRQKEANAPKFNPNPEALYDAGVDDPFGGNHNNRRVAERLAKGAEIVQSTAPVKPVEPPKTTAQLAKEALEKAKVNGAASMQEPPKVNEDYATAGAPVAAPSWSPNN